MFVGSLHSPTFQLHEKRGRKTNWVERWILRVWTEPRTEKSLQTNLWTVPVCEGASRGLFRDKAYRKRERLPCEEGRLHHLLADSLKVKMVHVPLCTLKYLPNECLAVPVSTAWACQQRDALLAERLLQGMKNFVKAFFIF